MSRLTWQHQRPAADGRIEDQRLVRGLGRFCDDIQLPGMLHLAILRSPLAHARIRNIDVTAAEAHPKVRAVVVGPELAQQGLGWMPTLAGDQQAILASDKVRYQGQEIAFVVADDRYAARDALELIDVDYDPLPPVIDASTALAAGTPVIRDELAGQVNNHCFDWETGDAEATALAFARADTVVGETFVFPRIHPAPLETCAAVADFDHTSGKLTVWLTSQAPHVHRTLLAKVLKLPEHKIRVISPDVGGGFGNKVPLYPGYVCAVVASMITHQPVKWVEDRTENLLSTSFARDFTMRGELAATGEGKILAARVHVLADHGAFNAVAAPSGYAVGFFGVFTGSYDLAAAYASVQAVYTNKAPGGVAYSCSFRIAEAVYVMERLVDQLARALDLDPADLRVKNFIQPEQFPYLSATGWEYDSGNYPATLHEALRIADYRALRDEQAERRKRGELMGIGLTCFTEAVGAGPRKTMDLAGLGMADGCSLNVLPNGQAVLRISVQSQGQGHETTFAQIVGKELGLTLAEIEVIHGDTDLTPYGLGTYGSRSIPVSGAATALVARKLRAKALHVAADLLEVEHTDLEWADGAFRVRAAPTSAASMTQVAAHAYGSYVPPPGIEGGLDEHLVYDPQKLTNPFGAYVCVVDVDPDTAVVKVRRFIAVDDCGTRINETIVQGQIHRGLTDGVGIALMELLEYDEHGNCLSGSLMDYLIPTALEVPRWETGQTVTPSPHHPLGAKGVGESATVGATPRW
jgi:aerobic carbon-monoxide dehydrogenase large subunit